MTRTPEHITTPADAKFSVAVPAEAGKPVTLAGYALVWDALSDDRGGYRLRIPKGAAKFREPTYAFFNHDSGQVLGSTANGSLRITPDDYGVKVEIDLPDTNAGRDAAELVGKGYVGSMSFAMADPPWRDAGGGKVVPIAPRAAFSFEGGQKVMTASAFTVYEVSVLPMPAYRAATVGVREGEGPAAFSAGLAAARLKLQKLRLGMLRV